MPRTAVKEDTVFKYDELDPQAQAKARDKYREGNLDYDWWDSVYEDADTIASLLGITLDRKGKRTPAIYFSGFCSQGDGACFEGSYRYNKGWRKALEAHAPLKIKVDGQWVECERNAELYQIGEALQDTQRRHFYRLVATVKQRGHYNHSGCTVIEVSDCESLYRDIGAAEDDIKTALRLFMDWIYDQLESEYDYLNSDEQIAESIRANDCEFLQSGERYL